MASDEFGEKTEQPTDHRRTEAREKGNVARSQDLNAAGLMLTAALAISVFGLAVLNSLGKLIQASLGTVSVTGFDSTQVVKRFRSLAEYSMTAVGPFVLMLVAGVIFVNFLQVGFMVTPEAIQPKLSRLNPIEGFKRIFSIRALVRLAGSLMKLLVVVAIAALLITSLLPTFLQLVGATPPFLLKSIHESVVTLAFQLAIALVALAILDFGFQKWKHEQDLRMTKQEVREEMKQMDGDPHMRQRRKEVHQKLAQAKELGQVKHADVVVTNPTHIAVALKYDPNTMPAPIVIAKGMGEIAVRIRTLAAEHRVPILERKEVARALYRNVKVGQQIPAEMYEVFVEIMAYVYRITGSTPDGLVKR